MCIAAGLDVDAVCGRWWTDKLVKPLLRLIVLSTKGAQLIGCIYVAIGQASVYWPTMSYANLKTWCLAHTIVVVASASESAVCSLLRLMQAVPGEYFRDRGEDALIAMGDQTGVGLSNSLLLRRPRRSVELILAMCFVALTFY